MPPRNLLEPVRPKCPEWVDGRLIEAAFRAGHFRLHYQPKLTLRSRKIDAAEALVRWTHPELGEVPPAAFVPVLEAGPMIRPFTEWTIAQAVADQTTLANDGYPIAIAVNVSGAVISQPDFGAAAIELTRDRSAPIILEITETAVIQDPVHAFRNMEALVAAELTVAIDDYGAGLSSLTYLSKMPARELKIDRSFVSNMTESHRDPLLVRSTIDLAHGLGMTVTAEGVERVATLELLRVMGCDHAQGFVIDRPMPLAALKRALAEPERLGRLATGVPLLAAAEGKIVW